jgi:hypothetical protein
MWRLLLSLISVQIGNTQPIIGTDGPQQLVAFQSVGKLIHTRGYAHLRFNIDLEKPMRQIGDFAAALGQQMQRDWDKKEAEKRRSTIFVQTMHLHNLEYRLQDMLKMDDPEVFREALHGLSRDKRFVELLQLGWGVFMGVYNQMQMAELRDQLSTLQRTQTAIIRQVDTHGQRLNNHAAHLSVLDELTELISNRTFELSRDLAQSELTTSLFTIAQGHVTDITSAVEAAMAQRASVLLAPLSTVAAALRELDASARSMGYELLVNKPSDVFQCRASYLVAPGGFEIFVHVPMAKKEDIFNLFRYLYIPVPVADGMTILIKPRHDLLAITGDETKFTTAPSAMLTSCQNTGAHFLCPDSNTYQMVKEDAQASRSEDACLFELYRRDVQGVKAACKSVVGPPGDAVFAVAQGLYVFTNQHPHKGIITCSDGSSSSFNAGPSTLVELRPGCTAKSLTHAATAPMDISQTVPSVIAVWPEDPVKLLAGVDLAYMAEIAGRPDIRALIPEDAAEAAAWLQDREAEEAQTTTGWAHTGLIIAICLALVASAVGAAVCWWKHTELQRDVLNSHKTQHLKEQAQARDTWLLSAASNVLKTQERPPAPVPWSRQSAKRELRNSSLYEAADSETYFLRETALDKTIPPQFTRSLSCRGPSSNNAAKSQVGLPPRQGPALGRTASAEDISDTQTSAEKRTTARY